MTNKLYSKVILGISDSHDAGAALIIDGNLIAAVNEERLSRKKMDAGFPEKSIKCVLNTANISPSSVDAVALAGRISLGEIPLNNDFTYDDGRVSNAQKLIEAIDSIPFVRKFVRSKFSLYLYRNLMPFLCKNRTRDYAKKLNEIGIKKELKIYDHHSCHIASAYLASGMQNCLLISNDGFGDALCNKIAIAKNGEIKEISQNSFFNSIGVIYNYTTQYCGFKKSHHAGKTTGLAAYGNPEKTLPIFKKFITWDNDHGIYLNKGPVFRNAIKKLYKELDGISCEDAAAGVQVLVEEILSTQAEYYVHKTGLKSVVLTGGIHANVKANQRIAELDCIDQIYVYPNMGDGGLSAGAAACLYYEASFGNTADSTPLKDVYLGPEITEQAAIEAAEAAGVSYRKPDNLARAIAEHLAEGKIVARAKGRMEYGPRALGNRSILYNATDPSVNSWLNSQLNRTEFMPFAPVLRFEDKDMFFKNCSNRTVGTAEFMTITYNVTEKCKAEAPAVAHVDGTARPQLIKSTTNPEYYNILSEYNSLTGLSILVNTSFNMHEEPIVCTAEEAVAAFQKSGLDILALGPLIIEKQ